MMYSSGALQFLGEDVDEDLEEDRDREGDGDLDLSVCAVGLQAGAVLQW